MAEKGRQDFWQGVRGICIIAVVLIHCQTAFSYQSMGALEWNYFYGVFIRQVADFAVGVFLFLSGYFVNQAKAVENPNAYLLGRLKRIGIPYLIWTLFYTLFSAGYSVLVTKNPYPLAENLLRNLFLGDAMPQMYFILVLLQLTLLTPLFLCWLNYRWMNTVLLFSTPLCILAYYMILQKNGSYPPYYNVLCFVWMTYYYLGLLVREKGFTPKLTKVKPWRAGAAVLGGILLCCLEVYLMRLKGIAGAEIVSQVRWSVLLYTTALILFFFTLSGAGFRMPRWLCKIGDASFGIYFTHMFFLTMTRAVMGKVPMGRAADVLPMIQLLELVPTLLLSFLFVLSIKKLFGAKFAAWLGC